MFIFLLGIGLLLLLLIIIRLLFVIVEVHGLSMAPTLQSHDRVIALRYWPKRWLRKGQIVVFTHYAPRTFQESVSQLQENDSLHRALPLRRFMKRIVGLGGETISIPRADLDEESPILASQKEDETGYVHWRARQQDVPTK